YTTLFRSHVPMGQRAQRAMNAITAVAPTAIPTHSRIIATGTPSASSTTSSTGSAAATGEGRTGGSLLTGFSTFDSRRVGIGTWYTGLRTPSEPVSSALPSSV